jgi:Uma2 family endonuclease
MTAFSLRFPSSLRLDEEGFATLAEANRDKRLELTATGELIIMPPTGGETGNRNSELNGQLWYWNSRSLLGKIFDSSTGFRLPNGAIRSPDSAWIPLEKWEKLSRQQRKKFLPICPDFVIELVSESDDIEETRAKMREYIANGTRLGWLLIPRTRAAEIYRPERSPEVIIAPDTLSGKDILLNFTADLRMLWE